MRDKLSQREWVDVIMDSMESKVNLIFTVPVGRSTLAGVGLNASIVAI